MRKFLTVAVLVAGCSSLAPCRAAETAPPDIKTIAQLQGNQLFDAAFRASPKIWEQASREDLWLLLDAIEAHQVERRIHTSTYQRAFYQFGERGTAADLPKLLELYERIPANEIIKFSVLDNMFWIWVRENLRIWKGPREPVRFEGVVPPLPPELADAPPELQEAWLYYEKIFQPYKSTFLDKRPRENRIPLTENNELFLKAVGQSFRGGIEGTPRGLDRFYWDSFCELGISYFQKPRMRAAFLGLWREERWAEAVGLVMDLASHDGNQPFQMSWHQEFLTRCGVDWEKAMVGAMLHKRWGAKELAMLGPDASVRYVLAMSQLPAVAKRYDFQFLAASYIEPANNVTYSRTSLAFGRPPERRVAPEIQVRLLDIIHTAVQSGEDKWLASNLFEELCALKRPESIPVLREALQAPQNAVRNLAYKTLLAMGQTVEAPAVLGSVRCRIAVNGILLRNVRVDWGPYSRGNTCGWNASQTDEDGVLEMARDLFVTPTNRPDSVEFRYEDPEKAGNMQFVERVPITTDLDQTLNVDIKLTELKLLVTGGAKFKAFGAEPRGVSFGIEREVVQENRAEWRRYAIDLKGTLGQGQSLRLQPGRYRFNINVSGAARLQSNPVAVGDKPATVELTVGPGADLKYSFLRPKDISLSREAWSSLWKDGQQVNLHDYWDDDSGILRGLPLGTYQIRITVRPESKFQQTAATPNYKDREVTVVLDGTRPLVDVGEIRLVPVAGAEPGE